MQAGNEYAKKYTETNELLQNLVMCNNLNHMDIQRPCVIFFPKIQNSELNFPHFLVITTSVFLGSDLYSSLYNPATSVGVK